MYEDDYYRQNIVSPGDRRRDSGGFCGCCPTLIAGPTGPIGPAGPALAAAVGVADAAGADDVVAQFNALLASLRAAGILST